MPHCFITGVSSGIGEVAMQLFLARGWQVSGVARRESVVHNLQHKHGTNVCLRVADVRDLDSLKAAAADATTVFGPFDVVVANAGHGLDGEITELATEDLLSVLDTNVLGVHRTLLSTREHWASQTRFVVVASIVSYLTVPRMGAYCASKHAIDAWCAALRMELRGTGHHVASMNPGTVATPFFDNAPAPGSTWTWRPGAALTPEQVARGIWRLATGRRRRRIIMPWSARILIAIYRVFPSIAEWLMRRKLGGMRDGDS